MRLGHLIAAGADQKSRCVIAPDIRARDEFVQPLDLVGKAMFRKKIQRAIGDRWLRAETCIPQKIQKRVGSQSTMLSQQQFKDFPSNRREPQPSLRTMGFRRSEPCTNTQIVIVPLEPKRRLLIVRSRYLIACH